jgi:hypothetical protein
VSEQGWHDRGPLRAMLYQLGTGRYLRGRIQRSRFARRSRRVASQLIGLPIDRAIDQADSHGYQVREVSPCSGLTFLTLDGRPFRITLWADEQGTVFRSDWG